jgi:hypothetical protein
VKKVCSADPCFVQVCGLSWQRLKKDDLWQSWKDRGPYGNEWLMTQL